MRVLVTRPERAARKTATLLRDLGHEPVLLPLTQPHHDHQAVRRAVATRPDALAVTSAEAIEALMSTSLEASTFSQIRLYAVGTATANAARQAGFKDVKTGKGDGRALADLVAETIASTREPQARLLYLAGRPRDGGFETALAEKGIPVDVIEVYAMQPIAWSRGMVEPLVAAPIDAVLLYSRETARQFFELVSSLTISDVFERSRFICISKKVLSAVPVPFKANASASLEPTEVRMLELLTPTAGT